RIAAVAPFTGLHCFPEGRGFKQWTGDDSKALMKVYLPAIEGYVPPDIIRTFRAFLEFCYLVRRNVITHDSLLQIEDALHRFHRYRTIFRTQEVIFNFSLPRQHSMVHYPLNIRLFGAPNGLCSSITESKHIKAVKKPWRRSNKNDPLGQMLTTTQRLDKISASWVVFEARGMLTGTCLSDILKHLHKTVHELSEEVQVPHLKHLICHFLFAQMHANGPGDPNELPAGACPRHEGKVKVFNSAAVTFFAPSDPSSLGGMRREHIRASPKWHNEYARNDCIFVSVDANINGMLGLEIARMICFFSFVFEGELYPCAVVHWFDKVGDEADEVTGMWVVDPGYHDLERKERHVAVIHIDSIYRSTHLIPVYATLGGAISQEIKPYHSYDTFQRFYVNKYADHHAFEIAF
ncbi:hypothetical protein HYDPIDRAFT_102171, partial [Hydnomerulius pinastri MD-312]